MYDSDVLRRHFDLWEYNEIQGDPGEPVSRWLVPHINHILLDRWLPADGCVLDAGCGRGVESVKMARRGLQVTALDISPGLLRHAYRRAEMAGLLNQINFVEADLTEKLPLPEDHFDVCLALTGVLGHVGERHREAIANLVAGFNFKLRYLKGIDLRFNPRSYFHNPHGEYFGSFGHST